MMMEESIQVYEIYGYWHSIWYLYRFFALKAVIGMLLAAFLIFLVCKWWQKRKKRFVPAWVSTTEQLRMLNLSQFVNDPKRCYDMMSLILRRYLLLRYDIDQIGLTDYELIEYMGQRGTVGVADRLDLFVKQTTITRFAHQMAARDELEKARAVALELVQKTIPS